MIKSVSIACILIVFCSVLRGQQNCLFKNPLCFYNMDILNYVQVLHKQQMYDRIVPFLYGPHVKDASKQEIQNMLRVGQFGYTLRRVGVYEIDSSNWSLTYERTILGTVENFKINCSLVGDTCRIYVDRDVWDNLFDRWK